MRTPRVLLEEVFHRGVNAPPNSCKNGGGRVFSGCYLDVFRVIGRVRVRGKRGGIFGYNNGGQHQQYHTRLLVSLTPFRNNLLQLCIIIRKPKIIITSSRNINRSHRTETTMASWKMLSFDLPSQ